MTYAPFEANRLRHPTRWSIIRSALGQFYLYANRLLEARRGRREIARLARNHDGLLNDIGLTRSDLDWALMSHWSEDPSQALARRMERRKNAAKWARSCQAS